MKKGKSCPFGVASQGKIFVADTLFHASKL